MIGRPTAATRALAATIRMAAPADGFDALLVLDALPHPIMTIGGDDQILKANAAAEVFFGTSLPSPRQHHLTSLLPPDSSLLALMQQVRETDIAVNEYRVDLGLPRLGLERLVDIFVSPVTPQSTTLVVMLRERSIGEKLDRQHAQRGASRSVSAHGLHAGARDQEPAVRHPRRGAAAGGRSQRRATAR